MSSINSDNQTSSLTEKDTKMTLFTTKTFNSSTGKYVLSNPVYVDPTEIDFSGDTKYYFQYERVSYNKATEKIYVDFGWTSSDIYQVTNATKTNGTTIWNNVSYDSIIYSLDTVTLTEVEIEQNKSDKGLYYDSDEYGTTYYYRGNVKNNNVYFAGFYWQIVRINGDGSIRLIYNGSKKNASGLEQSINNKAYYFNYLYNDPAYVGYMYGNPDGTTFDDVHTNTNSSNIKNEIDNWYKTKIVDNGYDKFISNSVGFCGDRTIVSGGDGVQTDVTTYFNTYNKFKKNIAYFICPNSSRDLYTTNESIVGNKALTYPVGLITYDELVFAGIDNSHTNKLSWIYSSNNYWTMTPLFFYERVATGYNLALYSDGYLNSYSINSGLSARPVINLKSDVKITGGIGTTNAPFVIDTN